MVLRSVLAFVAAAAFGGASFASAQTAPDRSGQPAVAGYDTCAGRSDGPCAFPRFNPSSVVVGATFSVPGVDQNNTMIAYGGSAVGVSEDGRYLYVSCRQDASGQAARGKVAKLEIPAPGGVARVVQPCQGLSMADLQKIHPDPTAYTPFLGGLVEVGGKLILDAYISYDATGQTNRSHWSGASLNTLAGPFSGTVSPGLAKSYMGRVPPEWQAMLGGDAYVTAGYMSIISRSSYGAAFSVFSSTDVTHDQFSMKMLLGCPHSVPSCVTWGTPQNLWVYNGSEQSGGAFIVPGTRTLYVVEREALGPTCYGYATRTQANHGKPYLDAVYCYSLSDPIDQKGPIGYPYQLVAKLYDLAELVDVKQGRKQPWEVKPYDVVNMPGSSANEVIGYTGGGAFNPVTGQYYLTRELWPDANGNAIVRVYLTGKTATGGTPTPTNLRATVSGSTIALTWSAASGSAVTDVLVEAGSAPGRADIVAGASVGLGGSYVASGVPNGTYYVRLRAVGPTGPSAPSNEVIASVGGGSVVIGTPPGAPIEPSAVTDQARTVTLSWYPPNSGAAPSSYVLDVGTSPGGSEITSSFSVGAATILSVPNVPPGVYYVRVRAVNAAGSGPATVDRVVVVR